MRLLQDQRDYSTWILHAKSDKGAILQGYIHEEEWRVEPSSSSKNYMIIRDLNLLKYGQKVLVSNDNLSRYEKEFVIYLPESNRYLCRSANKNTFFTWKYCKGITINDEGHTQTISKKQNNTG